MGFLLEHGAVAFVEPFFVFGTVVVDGIPETSVIVAFFSGVAISLYNLFDNKAALIGLSDFLYSFFGI